MDNLDLSTLGNFRRCAILSPYDACIEFHGHTVAHDLQGVEQPLNRLPLRNGCMFTVDRHSHACVG